MKKTWKQARIDTLDKRWGGCIKGFTGYTDDRQVYLNIYNTIREALESLPEEPLPFIRVAIWSEIKKDEEILERIYNTFCDTL